MTAWRAIVPLRGHGERKTRLAAAFSAPDRDTLALAMLHHVLHVLHSLPSIGEIAVLSSQRPPGWSGRLLPDRGRGLNSELQACANDAGARPLLVLHADLPLLTTADIAMLMAQAAQHVAIAPDRHGAGTNALAAPRAASLHFAFGPESCQRHLHLSGAGARLVRRQGLALDIDTMDDITAAVQAGWRVPLTQESVSHG
jgi:2-phospho-L-lactate guanylyltransferase